MPVRVTGAGRTAARPAPEVAPAPAIRLPSASASSSTAAAILSRWEFIDRMKKLVDYGRDDHPADDPDHAQVTWAIAVLDDCDGCDDLRVELTVEELGRPGTGLVAHLAPETARRLQAALRTALREVGEDSEA